MSGETENSGPSEFIKRVTSKEPLPTIDTRKALSKDRTGFFERLAAGAGGPASGDTNSGPRQTLGEQLARSQGVKESRTDGGASQDAVAPLSNADQITQGLANVAKSRN